MALTKLDQLYREVILDHSQHPRNKGLNESPQAKVIELHNPTCGDVVCIQLEVDDQQLIQNIRFTGEGCSISIASASMMSELVKGKHIDTAEMYINQFLQLVQGRECDVDLGDATILQGVSKFPARIKCATLAWKALEKGIKEEKGCEG